MSEKALYEQRLQPGEIRLIAFNSDWTDADLQLVTVDLDDSPTFAALSYTWGHPDIESAGTPEASEAILVNNIRVIVPTNLFDLINEFRKGIDDAIWPSISGVQWIWIDRICVNQDDQTEKTSQVGLMHRVYGQAIRTLCWIGRNGRRSEPEYEPDDPMDPDVPAEVSGVLSSLSTHETVTDEEIARLMGHDGDTLEFGRGLLSRLGLSERANCVNAGPVQAVYSFFNKAWFFRVWTMQEMALAKGITLIWGSERFDYSIIRNGLFVLGRFAAYR